MKYTEVKELEALRQSIGCYEDEFGNRPCDNGAYCDRCMQAQAEAYHEDIADITEAAHKEQPKWRKLFYKEEVFDTIGVVNKLTEWGFDAEEFGGNIAVRSTLDEYESLQQQMPEELLVGALDYDGLMRLALDHYNQGGDCVYECWGKQEFAEWTRDRGTMTVKSALSLFRMYKGMYSERF